MHSNINIHPCVTSQGIWGSQLNCEGGRTSQISLTLHADSEENQPQSVPTERQTAVKPLTNQCLSRKMGERATAEEMGWCKRRSGVRGVKWKKTEL